MKNKKLQKLVVSAMLIALSTALSFIKIWEMPLGGAVTLLSMVPMCVLALLYGVKYSVLPCVLYGAIQMLLGGIFSWGLSPAVLVGGIVFDYLFAFGVLSTAGIFRNGPRYMQVVSVGGSIVLRFISHLISGCIFFRSFDVFNNPYLYSLAYNGFYMLPELIITCVGFAGLIYSGTLDRIKKIA